MKAHEIIREWLKDNGYDGLCNEDCGCSVEDFMPCLGWSYKQLEECETAHKVWESNRTFGWKMVPGKNSSA